MTLPDLVHGLLSLIREDHLHGRLLTALPAQRDGLRQFGELDRNQGLQSIEPLLLIRIVHGQVPRFLDVAVDRFDSL